MDGSVDMQIIRYNRSQYALALAIVGVLMIAVIIVGVITKLMAHGATGEYVGLILACAFFFVLFYFAYSAPIAMTLDSESGDLLVKSLRREARIPVAEIQRITVVERRRLFHRPQRNLYSIVWKNGLRVFGWTLPEVDLEHFVATIRQMNPEAEISEYRKGWL